MSLYIISHHIFVQNNQKLHEPCYFGSSFNFAMDWDEFGLDRATW